jgi:16S rRNA (guanine527-N7)-methyltransferase
MTETELADLILAFMTHEGCSISEHQARLCAQHILLMHLWNRRVNLTRITDIKEILIKHLLDSLLPTRWLPGQGHALDIGTGAGFPGIPIKITYPGLAMVLLEAQRKKISFLKTVLSKLQLKSLCAVHGRWQDLTAADVAMQRYDLVTMRALRLNPAELKQLAQCALKPNGVLAWWTSEGDDDSSIKAYNAALLGTEIEFEGCFTYNLPSLLKPRRICIWKRSFG